MSRKQKVVIDKQGIRVVTVGVAGPRGASGKSAYQIAVESGFEGTEEEWIESLRGDVIDGGSY